jgi:hypothetical protein
MGSAFLLLLEVPLDLSFWNNMWNGRRIVFLFQGHSGNSTLVAAIVFPKTEEITRG